MQQPMNIHQQARLAELRDSYAVDEAKLIKHVKALKARFRRRKLAG